MVRNENKIRKLTKASLTEATRTQLLNKSKSSVEGKKRFNRRNKSKVANSVKQFNSIDMNKLFRENILTVSVLVHGETNDYEIKISFGGFLDLLNDEIKRRNGVLDLGAITKALVKGFNKDDIYVYCTCPDFFYRYNYWATQNKYNSGEPQNDNGKWIRNPRDQLGASCKHVLLILSNNSWLIKVASVINNYINYAKKNLKKGYADIIYPAIYKEKYTGDVQLSIFDDDKLATDKSDIDTSNEFGANRGKFVQGNQYRFKPSTRPSKEQQKIKLDDESN